MTTSSIIASHLDGAHSFREPTLVAMPKEVLLCVLQYVDDKRAHRSILALERTCQTFWQLLQDDNIWGVLASYDGSEVEEYHYPTTNRERAFLGMSIDNIRGYQIEDGNLPLEFLGGTNGVRRLVYSLLNAISLPNASLPRVHLHVEAIEYVTEVIQSNVILKLEGVLVLAIGDRDGAPGDGYPTVTGRDMRVYDRLFSSFHAYMKCSIAHGHHVCERLFYYPIDEERRFRRRGWQWPDHNCCGNEFLCENERQKLVRALGYRAGIVKMSGEVFSIISAEILHDMACLISRAIGMLYGDEGDRDNMMVEAEGDDEMSIDDNYSPLGWNTLVILPHHIKDAAEMMGMTPILFGYGCSGLVEGEDDQYCTEDSESGVDLESLESDSDSDSDSDSESEEY
jgi:hypothetical protein